MTKMFSFYMLLILCCSIIGDFYVCLLGGEVSLCGFSSNSPLSHSRTLLGVTLHVQVH